MLTPKKSTALQKFTQFDPGMVRRGFPRITAFQLDSGPLHAWLFSKQVGPYRVNAGMCNRSILYEGHYNPKMVHVGFIFSPEHKAVVHAHHYDSSMIAITHREISMHEVFSPNLIWVDISAPEEIIMQGISYSKTLFKTTPRLLLEGSREGLNPLIQLVTKLIQAPSPSALSPTLSSALKKILSARFEAQAHRQPFSSGDLFRARIIEEVQTLSKTARNQPLSLKDICEAVGMKPRTIQKYYRDLYGMGPTEYFRVRRLNGARSDLLHGATSVSEVALHWGFLHLGRFSGRYKAHFGESPKTTRDLAAKKQPA